MKMRSRSIPAGVWLLLAVAPPLLAASAPDAPDPASPSAPTPRPTPLPIINSPEVHADGSVTFRFRAPNAQKVEVVREGVGRKPMAKDDAGVWSLTTEPLEPDFYGYGFAVDGFRGFIDPMNPDLKPSLAPGLAPTQSVLHVPGPPSLAWELRDVPRGTLHRHFYHSPLAADDREFVVYTPPGYEPSDKVRYPVLYLLHGAAGDASSWTTIGRAHVILDNLIADGKARPMLVVMPYAYGVPELVPRWARGESDADLAQRNYAQFRQVLLEEVLPAVENGYRVDTGRQARAIAGLSMGGASALYVGVRDVDRFAWIGAFSTGGMGLLEEPYVDSFFSGMSEKAKTDLRLLWIACGTEDGVLTTATRTRRWLAAKGIPYTAVDTPGAHTWQVWRRNLVAFAPLLFRE